MYEQLTGYARRINLEITDKMLSQLDTYYNMVIERNKVMNLTAITDRDDFILKHFIDSISVMECPEDIRSRLLGDASLIDVGTGAGFPGMVLKILLPQLKVTLLDSLNKRVLFLDEVITALGLEDITTVHSRAEDGARTGLRDSFDIAVSRAVAAQNILTEYCLPYVKPGGIFIAYKSGSAGEEIQAAGRAVQQLGGGSVTVTSVTLSDGETSRCFAVTTKKSPTPKRFPRKAGTAKREPL